MGRGRSGRISLASKKDLLTTLEAPDQSLSRQHDDSVKERGAVRFSIGSESEASSGGRSRGNSRIGSDPAPPIRKSMVGTSFDPATSQAYRGFNGSGPVLPTDPAFDPVAFLSLVHSKATMEQLKQGRGHLTAQMGKEGESLQQLVSDANWASSTGP